VRVVGVRARIAQGLAVVAVVGLLVEAGALARTDREALRPGALRFGDAIVEQFTCIRGQVEALPAEPLFVRDDLPDGPLWRQRVAEFAFPEVPVVDDEAAAAQVAAVLPAPPGTPGACGTVVLQVTQP
jgi:hypothetical protein